MCPGPVRAFWSMVRAALAPGGRVCFIDSSSRERGSEQVLADQSTPAVCRRLRDGSEHRVVKVYYTPAELVARLAELGWSTEIRETSTPPACWDPPKDQRPLAGIRSRSRSSSAN